VLSGYPEAGPFDRRRCTIDLLPRGKITDFGDLIHEERWLLKGQHPTFIFHLGVDVDSAPADRIPATTSMPAPTGKVAVIVDLHADKKKLVTAVPGDEFDNPTTFAGTMTYVGDNPALLNVVDNGDGSAEFVSVGGTGNLGAANVTFTATPDSGTTPVVRVIAVNIIAGDAESFTFTEGPEEEVTPDV
jgi:hypothetical protein